VTVVPTTTLWESFSAKAALLGASVLSAASQAAAISLLPASAHTTSLLRERFPGVATASFASPDSPDVISAAEFAIAETGSVLVHASNADRRRMFLAQRLWLLVAARDIVPSLDVALDRVAELVRSGQPYVTLMSGPSRTADIERVLTIGVHGPAELTIVIVGE
jgi:L-lactate dehydrogenase complex protein LldG